MKLILLAILISTPAWPQCGTLVINPITHKQDCVGTGGGGANAVLNNQANTYTGGGTQNFGTSSVVIGATVPGVPANSLTADHVYSGGLALQPSTLLPSGGKVLEYAFNSGVGRVVANTVYPVQPNYNIFPWYPEQAFAGSLNPDQGVQGTNGAVTDAAGLNPYGEYTASRYVADAGGSQGVFVDNVSLTNGTHYVASIWVRSNTGSAQAMQIGLCNTNSSDITIPTTWTRVFFTCTAGSGQTYFFFIRNDAGSTAKDILFWGVQLETGTVPTTYPAQTLQEISAVGSAVNGADPSWQAWGIRFNGTSQYTGGIGGQALKFSAATVYMAIRKVGTIASSTYSALLGPQFGTNPQNKLSIWPSIPGCVTDPQCFSWTFSSTSLVDPLGPVDDNAWHVVVGLYDGAKLKLYVDYNETVEVAAASLAEVSFQDLALAAKLHSAYWPGDIGYVAVYNLAHSTSQIQTTTDAIRTIMTLRGQTMPLPNPYVVWEGDSITDVNSTAQGPTQGYVYLVSHALSSGAYIQPGGFAVTSSFLETMVSRGTAVDSAYTSTRATTKVLSILIGANIHLDTDTAPAWVATLKAYCLARKAATPGLKIVLGTLLPRTLSGFNTLRDAINPLIHADPSFYDAISDFAADPTIGCDACAANTTYYHVDGVHPTAAGQAIMATINQAAIQSVLP